jgi:rod shape-determining protein MreB
MLRIFARDLAIDLGTANTLIYERGSGIVLNEPSLVALRYEGSKMIPIAVGAKARPMLGRTAEGIKVIRPIRTGVIADFDAATYMVHHFISQVRGRVRSFVKPKIVVGVPSGVTEVERRAIHQSLGGQARDVKLLDEAMAAALGCNLPVAEASASMVVDIGGGTTDVAVISLNDVVFSLSIREGGDAIDEAIINHLRRNHHLLIGDATAEMVKKALGSAHPDFDNQEMEVRGRSLITGAPASIYVDSREVRHAMEGVLGSIIGSVRMALENTPPELSGDIISRGLALAGGGALIRGIDRRISEELNVTVVVANDPLVAVVEGAGRYLENHTR